MMGYCSFRWRVDYRFLNGERLVSVERGDGDASTLEISSQKEAGMGRSGEIRRYLLVVTD